MQASMRTIITCLVAVGCATAQEPTENEGIAEIRVDASALVAADITRVTVIAGAMAQDLVFNPSTITFDGTLFLQSGPQSLVAQAFSGDILVAQSPPTLIDVVEGVVTRVELRILDVGTSAPPIYGPIIDSLTYPTTTQAGTSVTFAVSAVSPSNDPVTYSWSSDCPDSTFSAPRAATTSWSKPGEGTCTISVQAASNGFTTGQSFSIVVFPTGSGTGAVKVSGVLVSAPLLHLGFFGSNLDCSFFPGSNASCPQTIALPSASQYAMNVPDWGGSSPSTLEIHDNCGGRFGLTVRSSDFRRGYWLPPAAGGLCIVTARAVNSDGLASNLTAAIVAHPGTPRTAQPPRISAQIGGFCFPNSEVPEPLDCGEVAAGTNTFLIVSVNYADGLPGSVEVLDNCGGAEPLPLSSVSFSKSWQLPNTPGTTCTTTIRAINLEGGTAEVTSHYRLSGGAAERARAVTW
jgi:hypothetical protein